MNTNIKILIVVALTAIAYSIGLHLGKYSYIDGKLCNTKEAYLRERELNTATTEMLHMYWEYNDVEYINDSITARHNFWLDCIMETDSYYIADSLRNHDWSDFEWEHDCSTEYDM